MPLEGPLSALQHPEKIFPMKKVKKQESTSLRLLGKFFKNNHLIK
jgi:hypothetical protein